MAVAAAPRADATSYVSLSDAALADQSPLIVIGRVSAVAAPGSAAMDYSVDVERTLKGAASGTLRVRVQGGPGPRGKFLRLFAAPSFQVGERVVLFLAPRPDGSYGIQQFMLGAFHDQPVGGRRAAMRHLSGAHQVALPGQPLAPERPRDFEKFTAWLAARAAGARVAPDYVLEGAVPNLTPHAQPFTLFDARWFEFDTGGSVAWRAHSSGQSGNGGAVAQFQVGLAAWNNESRTPIIYMYTGTTTASGGFAFDDGVNTILWDDPNGEMPGSFNCSPGGGGILAIGGNWYDPDQTGTFKGKTYFVSLEGDIITQNAAGCFFAGNLGKNGEEVSGHELGHTLGLGHSCGDSSSGSCNTTPKIEALMRAFAHGDGRGAELGTDDQAGVQFVYESDRALSINDMTVSEGNTGTKTVTFTVTLSSPASTTVTVNYATGIGTATTVDGDYVPTSGTLTFIPGDLTETLNVTINGDTKFEVAETFVVNLGSSVNAGIADGQGQGTITNDDPAPTLSIGNVSVPEGNAGSVTAVFPVTLSAVSGVTASANWTTMDGTATAASGDYVAASGMVTIPVGAMTATITVTVNGDTLREANETFIVRIVSVTNATAGGNGVGMIQNDDRLVLCTSITALPYTITAQGNYCLTRNLSTSIASGAAITINSDFVNLDLKGFKIGGGAAGAGTQANGVYALNRKNITVKNGNIRGFFRAVFLEDDSGTFTASQGHLVQSVRADENMYEGIHVQGRGNMVRNNQVVATGGTTVFGANPDAYGIHAEGAEARVLNNDVTDTNPSGAGSGLAIAVEQATGAVVEKNRLANSTANNSYGVKAVSGNDILVIGNRIAATSFGVFYDTATGKYRDNLVTGVGTPYTGATDAGNNQ